MKFNKLVFEVLLLTAMCGLTTESFSQSNYEGFKKITPELLKQDFTVFRDSLQQLHPGLYRYRDKKTISNLFDSCFSTLNNSMSEIEFIRIISYMVSVIEDGHTSCFLPKETTKHILLDKRMFPIQLHVLDDRAYICCDTKSLPAQTELTAINGIPTSEIIENLFHYMPSDGAIQTGKYWEMNYGDSPFFFLYYLVYGEKSTFNVEYKMKTGESGTITLKADYFKNLQCPPERPKIGSYLNLNIRQNNIAVLTIRTFSDDLLKKTNEDFMSFLDTSFKEINDKNVQDLIIDLRNNRGGQDLNGSKLYSYLTDKPFHYYASLETTTRKLNKNEHPNLGILNPEENNFKGNVFILINGKSFSATAEFCAVAKSNSIGKFIGEESGGGYYGNTSGGRKTLILPNTKIRINIPLTKYVMDVKKAKYKDRGIIPDYTVLPSIEDIINNKDIEMDFAIKLAEKSNQR